MSFCNRTKNIVKENVERKPFEKQWNLYCTCELRKCDGIKKSDTGIHIN